MEVTTEDTFECAIRLIKQGYRPVVLDFASGSNPGGGWRGQQRGTQEESLCRRSNLGLLLEKKPYPMRVDALYYLPTVTITKDLDLKPIASVTCSVIASELKCISGRSSDYLRGRIDAVYRTALDHDHDVIVLGAWGLGAFKETDEDSKILAVQMKRCAEKNHKIKTVFALYGNKENYKVFKQII
jgi:uncharacterized protein (TIGR02452 family)